MKKLGALAVVAFLISGCGGGGAAAGPASGPPKTTATSRAEAQVVLDRSLKLLTDGETGSFQHIVTIGSGAYATTATQSGSFDIPRKDWRGSFTAQQGSDPATGPIQFIGTAQALYLTSPAWPAKIRGRWIRYTSTELDTAAGGAAQVDLADGQPIATSVLFQLKARSATNSPQGTTVTAELPSSSAVVLAHLKSGLAKQQVDPSTIKGVTEVTLDVAPDGTVRSLKMATDALNGVMTRLPTFFAPFRDQVGVVVTYGKFAVPLTLKIPTGKELLSPAELRP